MKKEEFYPDHMNAFNWLVIFSLIIAPLDWQIKLLILGIIASLISIIFHAYSEIKFEVRDRLIEIKSIMEMHGLSNEEAEEKLDAMDRQYELDIKKQQINQQTHNAVAMRLYIRYFLIFVVCAVVFYLSEYPNLKNLLDMFF